MNFLMMSNAEAHPPAPHTKDRKQKALAGASQVEYKVRHGFRKRHQGNACYRVFFAANGSQAQR